MMTAPPRDQHHESADDSENGSFRHFLTHLVCMLERPIDCDLRDNGLVTRTCCGRARAGSQSIVVLYASFPIREGHHERIVMSDFNALTSKWATMLTANAAITADISVTKKNRMIGINAPIAVEIVAMIGTVPSAPTPLPMFASD
jgi:hypothetical protein